MCYDDTFFGTNRAGSAAYQTPARRLWPDLLLFNVHQKRSPRGNNLALARLHRLRTFEYRTIGLALLLMPTNLDVICGRPVKRGDHRFTESRVDVGMIKNSCDKHENPGKISPPNWGRISSLDTSYKA